MASERSAVSEMESLGRRLVGLPADIEFGSSPLGAIIGDLYGLVYGALTEDLQDAGGNVIHYTPTTPRGARMFVGVQWPHAAPPGLELLTWGAGPVAHARHHGPYHELHETHVAIHAWMREQGYAEVGANWEVYGDWSDDPAELVTDVFYALERSA